MNRKRPKQGPVVMNSGQRVLYVWRTKSNIVNSVCVTLETGVRNIPKVGIGFIDLDYYC